MRATLTKLFQVTRCCLTECAAQPFRPSCKHPDMRNGNQVRACYLCLDGVLFRMSGPASKNGPVQHLSVSNVLSGTGIIEGRKIFLNSL